MSTSTQTHLMTAEELMNIDDDSHRHELIKGELLTMPHPTFDHGRISANLMMLLGQFVKVNRLGQICGRTGYILENDPDTVLGPDVSFITKDRIQRTEGYYFGPPDLAVEVLSPRDSRGKVGHNLSLWLEFGTRSVWLIDPRRRTVEICKPTGERTLFHEADELVDDTVPGFCVKVSEIFS